MTDAQRTRLYFPAWRRALAAGWTVERGIVQPNPPATEQRVATTDVAFALAQRRVRRLTAEDLRHASNALAIQHERTYRSTGGARLPGGGQAQAPLVLSDAAVSSSRLSPLALDLWLCWARLLVDDTLLDALIRWENPEQIEHERLVRGIVAGGASGYAAKVCADMHGTSDWESLPLDALRNLHATLRQRRNAWRNRTDASYGTDRTEQTIQPQELAKA